MNSKFLEVEADFKEVNNRLDFIERQNLINDVLVTGIPYREHEDVFKLFNDICNALGCNKSSMIIDSIFRLPGSKEDRPIIVKFVTSMSKIEIFNIYNQKSTSLTLKSIGFSISDRRIYINSCLTKKNRIIHQKARELFKKQLIKKFYVSKGNIFIISLDENNSKPKKMATMNDFLNVTAGISTAD